MASLFYTRLNQFDGPARPLPWYGITHPENAAPITVGQLKRAFAFQFTATFLAQNANAGSGAPPPWWISYYELQNSNSSTDSDFDGIPDLGEYATGSDPKDEDSDDDYAPDKEETDEGFLPRDNTSAPLRLCWLHDDTSLGMNYVGPNPPPWSTNYYSENFFKSDKRGGVLQYGGRGDFPGAGVLGVIHFAGQQFSTPPNSTTELNAWNFPQFTPNDRVGRSHVEVKTEGDDHYNTQTVHLWLRGPKTASSVTRTFLKRVNRTMHNNIGYGLDVDVSPPDEPYQIMTFTIPPNSNKSDRQWLRLIQSTTMGPAPVVTSLPKLDYREYVDAYLLPVEARQELPVKQGGGGDLHLCRWNSPHTSSGDLVNPWGVANLVKSGQMLPALIKPQKLIIKTSLQTALFPLGTFMAKEHTSHDFWNLRDSLRRARERAARYYQEKRTLETKVRDLERSRLLWRTKYENLTAPEPIPALPPPAPKPPGLGRRLAEPRPICGLHFSSLMVTLALQFYFLGAFRYRAVGRILTIAAATLHGLSGPCFTTVRMWILRMGLYRLQSVRLGPRWAMICDHTATYGGLKLLVICGVDLDKLDQRVADLTGDFNLHHDDLQPLAVVPMKQSSGELLLEIYLGCLEKHGSPVQMTTDGGSDILKSARLLAAHQESLGDPPTKHHYDISHRIARIVKAELEPNLLWQNLERVVTKASVFYYYPCDFGLRFWILLRADEGVYSWV